MPRTRHSWTPHEDELLAKLYPHTLTRDLLRHLPRHTWNSIHARANKLGIYKTAETLRKQPLAWIRKYPLNEAFFSTWSKEMAYVLGWVVSDGYVGTNHRKRLEWQLADREPLELFQHLLETTKPIETCHKKHGIYFRLRICSRQVVSDLLALGIGPCKSNTLEMPPVPDKYFYHFLRGVLDGDGCIMLRPGSATN